MCRARPFQFLVDRASDGGSFTSVLRTKMAISRVLPGEATVPCAAVSFFFLKKDYTVTVAAKRRGKITYAMLQKVHTSGLSRARPAFRLCPSDFRCLARLSGFTIMQH
jgi:hypothetical protein